MIRLFKPPSLIQKFYSDRIWRFSSSSTIYLTFDDGPTDFTPWILKTLEEKGVKATFFCVGQNAKDNPEMMGKMVSAGHAIGNHTMLHDRGGKVSKQAYLESIDEASKYIDSSLFRPPYGKLPKSFDASIREKYSIIMWTWLSYDFDIKFPVSDILSRAKKEVKAGDIIVLHDNIKVQDRTKDLLPQLIDDLLNRGFKFEIISA